ncbi:MAG: hypothetical protein JW822_13670 [Spirochaetales bacterium]|nr:hypothetical protein [Spirochaetales bacterium]
MKRKLLLIFKCAVFFTGMAFLSACAFRGEVYVAFYWSTANDQPNPALSDFSNIPNAPSDLNNLINGGYFLTIPGTYAIDYIAVGGGSYPAQSITLEAASTIGGFETTYYNIFLSDGGGLTVDTVP